MSAVRILVVSDTHVGYDHPARARSGRRIRGLDFLSAYERALAPALVGEVDLVIHAGDVFDHPEPPAAVADMAYAPLRAIAESGVPVVVVAGNHDRSRLPYPLLVMHERIAIVDRPRTLRFELRGTTVAIGAFPYARRVRRAFARLVHDTGVLDAHADVRLLVVHHCIEGACVSLPDGGDYSFTDAADVIAGRDIPGSIAALLSGHIHRHQILERWPCPVIYGGSTERTAFAEARETKGCYVLTVEPGGQGGRVRHVDFRPLRSRPMVRQSIDPDGDVPAQLRALVHDCDPEAIVRLEVPGEIRSVPGLSAAALRRATPSTMNVHVVFDDREPRWAPLSRSRRRPATRSSENPMPCCLSPRTS